MSEDQEQFPPAPAEPEAKVNAAWLADAIAQLRTRGDAVSRLGCMALPAPVFNDLCERLIAANGDGGVGPVIEWLHGQVGDAPSRSAVYRFAGYLREEYRTARSLDRRRGAKDLVATLTEGEPEAMQLAVNFKLTERLGDLLDRTDDLENLDPKAFDALVKGVRMVSQTAFDKRKMDAALRRANSQIEKLNLQIRELESKFEQAAKSLQAKAGEKRAITDEDIAAVRKAVFG